jgi:hypothetical protein
MEKIMKTIWKYDVPIDDNDTEILMPSGAKILHVTIQMPHIITFWAIVNNSLLETRTFRVFGTGQEIPDEYNYYLGTIMDKQFVWHLLEK